MPESRAPQGLIDTSVVIDLDQIDADELPVEVAISAITLAELAAGPHATADPGERARRQDRLQRVEATFEPLPVNADVARAYGRVYAAVAASGRKARGRRAVDLLIAATAVATGLPLYTRNPDDFAGMSGLLEIVERHAVEAARAVAPRAHPVVIRKGLQVPAGARLRQLQDSAQLGHGQLVLLEEQQEAAPRRIRQRRHVVQNRDHISVNPDGMLHRANAGCQRHGQRSA